MSEGENELEKNIKQIEFNIKIIKRYDKLYDEVGQVSDIILDKEER